MKEQTKKEKLSEFAIKQNLLLWQLSKSFLDIDEVLNEKLEQ